MSVDATTQAALEAQILRMRVLLYGDFDGDPMRVTSGLNDKTISGSGDSELDGTYESLAHNLLAVSPVQHSESGSDTVSVVFGGLIVNDLAFLNFIGDRTNWQGRTIRLWFYCVDDDEAQVGEIIPYYTGYMNDLAIGGSPQEQTVTITIENYLATLAGSSGKTYGMQAQFDSGDNSASSTIAVANVAMGGAGGIVNGAAEEKASKKKKRGG
jgi:hypothetical protein